MIYMGSKGKISKELKVIIDEVRQAGQWYVEPFCGGCNMMDKMTGNRIAGDKHKYLIAMHQGVQDGYPFPQEISKEYYNDVRTSYKTEDGRFSDALIGWVGWTSSFNGRFFEGGYSGKGKDGVDYIARGIKNILTQAPLLADVNFVHSRYDELQYPEESVIYCDPPYLGTSPYDKELFDYSAFYDWLKMMKKKGHKVFISEWQMNEDFRCVWEKPTMNTISLTASYAQKERLYIPK